MPHPAARTAPSLTPAAPRRQSRPGRHAWTLFFALGLAAALPAHAQWTPTGALARIPVYRDCDDTGGDVAVSRLAPPAIYVCPAIVRFIRRHDPGAEHFYLVHEYGHIALQTADEAQADCWAARALADARNGARYLDAMLEHLRKRPDEARAGYGTPSDRAATIRRCAAEVQPGIVLVARPMTMPAKQRR